MAVNYTSLLGLAKPVTGTEAGLWGDVVNDYLTTYLDSAIAGTQTISGTQTAVTLSTTTGGTPLVQAAATSAGSAQYQIINCTGNPASTLVITAPASSKVYLVINATSTNQSVTVRGAGPTTGVTIPALTRSLIAWNGSDYILIASNRITDLTGTLTTGNGGTGLTTFTAANNAIYSTSSSALTAGTLPVAAGGTGATTLTANNVLLGNGTSAVQVVAPSTSGNVLTSNGTTWVSSAAAPGGNKIINGAMQIAQRGTSFTSVANGTYTLDRWLFNKAGTTGVLDITQNLVDYPSGTGFRESLRATVTTADSAVATGDYSFITQRIEGPNITDLIGATFTLSFWVRSAKTGTHCVAFDGFNSSGPSQTSYVAEYTVSAANTWEQKTITVTNGLTTSFTWRDDAGVNGAAVSFILMAGSSHQATVNTWTGGFPLKLVTASGSATNLLDTVGNIFAITGVQLSVGSTASSFQFLPFGQNLALCQRYFEKSYDVGVVPGTVTTAGEVRSVSITSTDFYTQGYTPFKVSKSNPPSMLAYNPATGASGQINNNGTSVAGTFGSIGTNAASLQGAGMTTGVGTSWHFTATAEI